MARHFVAYQCEYESLNEDGSVFYRDKIVISGFVMQIHGAWFWITAGHALDELTQVRILPGGGFIDSFGWEAGEMSLVPYTYAPEDARFIFDKEYGVDFGLLLLDWNKRTLFANAGHGPKGPRGENVRPG